MEEIWKDVVGYEGLYKVSNKGRILSCNLYSHKTPKILSQPNHNSGYYCIGLSKGGVTKKHLVHRIVAEAFLPNPNNYGFVNHKDENKKNNCVENLEWCTKSYNSIYYLNMDESRKMEYGKRFLDKKTGKNLSPMVQEVPRKYTQKVVQMDRNCSVLAVYENYYNASEVTGIKKKNIVLACKKTLSGKKARNHGYGKAGGYLWRFEK